MSEENDEVIFRVQGSRIEVVINRPEKNNVLNNEIRGRMMEFLRKYENDGSIRTVIFTSNGKNFSAGADLKNLLSLDEESVKDYTEFVREFLGYIQNYPKATIGAVHGVAVGGGLELLLSLDLVLATEDSRFGQTELNVGLIPGGGGTQRLPRAAGVRKAREMIFTGRLIKAQEAYQYGLINRIVEADSLMEEAIKLSERIGEKSALSIALAKRAINDQWKETAASFELESELYARILLDPEGKEGMNAFLEKRQPDYRNRV